MMMTTPSEPAASTFGKLNHKLQTLNPRLLTWEPKPQTLKPKPTTLDCCLRSTFYIRYAKPLN